MLLYDVNFPFIIVGFGLSEKVNDITIHTPEFHTTLFVNLIEALDLKKFTVVGQDWGGPIAALVAARLKDRYDRSDIFSTFLTDSYIYIYIMRIRILNSYAN